MLKITQRRYITLYLEILERIINFLPIMRFLREFNLSVKYYLKNNKSMDLYFISGAFHFWIKKEYILISGRIYDIL